MFKNARHHKGHPLGGEIKGIGGAARCEDLTRGGKLGPDLKCRKLSGRRSQHLTPVTRGPGGLRTTHSERLSVKL